MNCDKTVSRNVTEQADSVTPCHEPSQPVTTCHSVPSLAVPSLAVPSQTRGGPGEPAPLSLTASPAPAKRNGSKPIKIPEDWKPSDRQVEALAEKHGVKPDRIRAEVSEFIWYWSDGSGAGKARSPKGWAQTFGNRIDEQAKRGVLFAAPTPVRDDVRSKLQRELEEMDQPYADS
jgi:hypothetical protein